MTSSLIAEFEDDREDKALFSHAPSEGLSSTMVIKPESNGPRSPDKLSKKGIGALGAKRKPKELLRKPAQLNLTSSTIDEHQDRKRTKLNHSGRSAVATENVKHNGATPGTDESTQPPYTAVLSGRTSDTTVHGDGSSIDTPADESDLIYQDRLDSSSSDNESPDGLDRLLRQVLSTVPPLESIARDDVARFLSVVSSTIKSIMPGLFAAFCKDRILDGNEESMTITDAMRFLSRVSQVLCLDKGKSGSKPKHSKSPLQEFAKPSDMKKLKKADRKMVMEELCLFAQHLCQDAYHQTFLASPGWITTLMDSKTKARRYDIILAPHVEWQGDPNITGSTIPTVCGFLSVKLRRYLIGRIDTRYKHVYSITLLGRRPGDVSRPGKRISDFYKEIQDGYTNLVHEGVEDSRAHLDGTAIGMRKGTNVHDYAVLDHSHRITLSHGVPYQLMGGLTTTGIEHFIYIKNRKKVVENAEDDADLKETWSNLSPREQDQRVRDREAVLNGCYPTVRQRIEDDKTDSERSHVWQQGQGGKDQARAQHDQDFPDIFNNRKPQTHLEALPPPTSGGVQGYAGTGQGYRYRPSPERASREPHEHDRYRERSPQRRSRDGRRPTHDNRGSGENIYDHARNKSKYRGDTGDRRDARRRSCSPPCYPRGQFEGGYGRRY